jgi:hypothetical protein
MQLTALSTRPGIRGYFFAERAIRLPSDRERVVHPNTEHVPRRHERSGGAPALSSSPRTNPKNLSGYATIEANALSLAALLQPEDPSW